MTRPPLPPNRGCATSLRDCPMAAVSLPAEAKRRAPPSCRPWPCSHLTTLRDGYIEVRHVFAAVPRLGHLHLLDDVHAIHHLSEDDVLAVEERRGDRGDEELRAVGVGASVLVGGPRASAYILLPRETQALTGNCGLQKKERKKKRTAMERSPGRSCFRLKFSSAKVLVPYMQVDPVPSPFRKSPPWHMNWGIWGEVCQ